MRLNHYARMLAAGIGALTLAVVGGGAAYAVAASSITQTVVSGPDHQRLVITLAPGASHTFKLPATNDPVRIDLDATSVNGGVQTPSEVFSALVNADANSAGISWIGTSSDGSQTAGSTIHGTDITNLTCGSGCLLASLNAASVSSHTVTLSTNAATTTLTEKFVVNEWH